MIRVLLADSHQLLHLGIRTALSTNNKFTLIDAAHCVNIGWDTSHSEFSVEFEGEEEQHDDTKIYRHTQQEWHRVS
ncbi:MAG: hypothetical protein BroJett014_24190 [Planctomycetota bacterium]|nr:MAG: hypothetical protein BroJett014_24190 [Planctomycetota bacterium]